MKRKTIAAILAAVLIFTAAGCETKNDPETTGGATSAAEGQTGDNAGDATTDEGTDDNQPSAGKFDLPVPPHSITNGTLWSWVSDGTDEIDSGVDVAEFQNAKYLIIECGNTPEGDARTGLAWQSDYANWDWVENPDFSLADYISGNTIALPLADLLNNHDKYDYLDFKSSDTEYIKIYFRYGDENDEEQKEYMETLDIKAVYFADSV